MVDKKYGGYIAVVSLRLEKIMDSRYVHISLIIRHASFFIGYGSSSLQAVNMALRVVKTNNELKLAKNVFTKGDCVFLDEDLRKIKYEIKVIKECAI